MLVPPPHSLHPDNHHGMATRRGPWQVYGGGSRVGRWQPRCADSLVRVFGGSRRGGPWGDRVVKTLTGRQVARTLLQR